MIVFWTEEEYEQELKQVREKTIKEIFSTVIMYPVFSFIEKTPNYTLGYMQGVEDYREQIKKIAKEEFDVEVED